MDAQPTFNLKEQMKKIILTLFAIATSYIESDHL